MAEYPIWTTAKGFVFENNIFIAPYSDDRTWLPSGAMKSWRRGIWQTTPQERRRG